MMFNATFNNISAISWRSVLLVEETRVPGENYWPFVSHWQTYHIMLYRWHLAWVGFELTILVVIGTDCIGILKSNYRFLENYYQQIMGYLRWKCSDSVVFLFFILSIILQLHVLVVDWLKSQFKATIWITCYPQIITIISQTWMSVKIWQNICTNHGIS